MRAMADVTIDPRGVTGYVPVVSDSQDTRELFLPDPAAPILGRAGSSRWTGTGRRTAPGRGIRFALAVTAVAVVLAATAVGAVAGGLVRVGPSPVAAAAGRAVVVASRTQSGPASATYRMAASSYGILLHATGPCWVQVTSGGQTLFAGTLPAGASKLLAANGTTTVELGASAVQVVVSSGSARQSLFSSLAKAPFTLTLAG